jgi:hypothetical protein
MSDNQNAIQNELNRYDAFEADQVEGARANGFSEKQIEIAEQDIAFEREVVADGVESADDAEDNVADTIRNDLFGTDEYGDL